MINVCISYITPKVQKTEEKAQNKIDKSQNILDTYIFNPKNIESEYWRTFLVILRDRCLYLLISCLLTLITMVIQSKIVKAILIIVVFLCTKIFIDKNYNFIPILDFIFFIVFTLNFNIKNMAIDFLKFLIMLLFLSQFDFVGESYGIPV
jgi:hypothetical protein